MLAPKAMAYALSTPQLPKYRHPSNAGADSLLQLLKGPLHPFQAAAGKDEAARFSSGSIDECPQRGQPSPGGKAPEPRAPSPTSDDGGASLPGLRSFEIRLQN